MLTNYKQFLLWVFFGILAVVLFNVIYIGRFTQFSQIDSSKLALVDQSAAIDEKENSIRLYEKDNSVAKQIIEMAYGPYAPFIFTTDLKISVSNEGEYTLPQVRFDNEDFVIRENPALRYKLWEHQPPDVVLLGSSMFFQNINRAEFFKKVPNRHMIDFCIGDNTPPLTMFLLKKLDDCQFWFKPGSTVIYGINTYELMQGYYGKTVPHVIEALKDVEDHSIKKELNEWLRQTLKTQGPKFLVQREIRKFKRKNVRYLLPVSYEMSQDPERLKGWLLSLSPRNEGDHQYPLDKTKVDQLINIIRFVKESNSRFILILLPSSSWDIGRHGPFVKSLDHILDKVSKITDVEYYNLWNHQTLGIDDTDFIIEGHRQLKLNPQHLNYEGTLKFTDVLIELIMKQGLNSSN